MIYGWDFELKIPNQKFFKKSVDFDKGILIISQNLMGQQLRKRLKRQRRDARKKRVQARLRAGMKK